MGGKGHKKNEEEESRDQDMNEHLLETEMARDVSIIIVNWNTKDLLLQCIQSIKTHTHKTNLEIIVVDNASTDGSQAAVKKRFPDIELIQNENNVGFAKANNIGIAEGFGRHLCFVNSDILVKDDSIDRMFLYMESNPEVGILGPRLQYADGSVQISCKRFPTIWNYFCEAFGLHRLFPKSQLFSCMDMRLFKHDRLCDVECVSGAFWLARKKAIENVGLLDEAFFFYGEDLDWCKRFWEKDWRVVFFPDCEIVHYHGRSSDVEPTKYYIQLHRARLKYWEKHHKKAPLLCVKAIMMMRQLRGIFVCLFLYIVKPSKRKEYRVRINNSMACAIWLCGIR